MAGVRFEGLSKTYPSRGGSPLVEVIRQLDLAIDDGEFLSIQNLSEYVEWSATRITILE